MATHGYQAVKFGWGPYGRASVREDRDQVHAARQGLGPDARLLIDAGTVWDDAIEEAAARLPALRKSALPGWKNLSFPRPSRPIGLWRIKRTPCLWLEAKGVIRLIRPST